MLIIVESSENVKILFRPGYRQVVPMLPMNSNADVTVHDLPGNFIGIIVSPDPA